MAFDDVAHKFAGHRALPPEKEEEILCEIGCELLSHSNSSSKKLLNLHKKGVHAFPGHYLPQKTINERSSTMLIPKKSAFSFTSIQWVKEKISNFIVWIILTIVSFLKSRKGKESDSDKSDPASLSLLTMCGIWFLQLLVAYEWIVKLLENDPANCERDTFDHVVRCISWQPRNELYAVGLCDDSVHIFDTKSQKWLSLVLRHDMQINISRLVWQSNADGGLVVGGSMGICFWHVNIPVSSTGIKTQRPRGEQQSPILYDPWKTGRSRPYSGTSLNASINEATPVRKGKNILPFTPQTPRSSAPIRARDPDEKSKSTVTVTGLAFSRGSGVDVKPPFFLTAGQDSAWMEFLSYDGEWSIAGRGSTIESTNHSMSHYIARGIASSVKDGHHFDANRTESVVEWSPDGRYLAVGSSRGNFVCIWDVSIGQCSALERHNGGTAVLSWSPDGSYLFVGTTGRNCRVWSVADWHCENWCGFSNEGCRCAVWGPDCRTILVSSKGSSLIHTLHLESPAPKIGARLVSVENLTSHQTHTKSGTEQTVGGPIKVMTWNETGEHLAVSFEGTEPGSELIALFATRVDVVTELVLLGFIRGPKNCTKAHLMFFSELDNGALLWSVWDRVSLSDGIIGSQISTVPLMFASSDNRTST